MILAEPVFTPRRSAERAAVKKLQRKRSTRAGALAERLIEGARVLEQFAAGLTQREWDTCLPGDGRSIGVIIHHVARIYPVEIQLAQAVAKGEPVRRLTAADIDAMNAVHANEFPVVSRVATLQLLRENSAAAAYAIRKLSDENLDAAVAVSLYGDAPLTCQFVLEDHAVRHSYHHLARIRRALQGHTVAAPAI